MKMAKDDISDKPTALEMSYNDRWKSSLESSDHLRVLKYKKIVPAKFLLIQCIWYEARISYQAIKMPAIKGETGTLCDLKEIVENNSSDVTLYLKPQERGHDLKLNMYPQGVIVIRFMV